MQQILFPIFLILTLVELGFEVRISKRNSKNLLKQGAKEIAPGTLPLMTALYVLMYAGAMCEFLWLRKSISVPVFCGFGVLYVGAKALKYWAVKSLGRYWTMKVLIVPGSHVVVNGPYRWIRHPNYVAVLMEIAGTTLPGKAWITCLGVLVLFSVVLYHRIRREEEALAGYTDYSGSMADKRRFVP